MVTIVLVLLTKRSPTPLQQEASPYFIDRYPHIQVFIFRIVLAIFSLSAVQAATLTISNLLRLPDEVPTLLGFGEGA